MRVTIKERKVVAKNTLMVTFDTGGQDLGFKAGQFATFTLSNPPYTDNRGNNRFFGFSTSPTDKNTFSITTRTGVSAFKRSLAELPLGTALELTKVDGHIILPEDKNIPVVFVAFGIGISPIMGILRYSHENFWPYQMTLVYINENRESTPYLDELEKYAKETDKFRLICSMLNDRTWTGEKRGMSEEFLKSYFQQIEKYRFFVTGPVQFVPGAFKQMRDSGVPIQNLTMEIFTGY